VASIHQTSINRAPVLTLWAAVVAERVGFDHQEALTLGRAVAGLNAYSKGKSLGLFAPTPKEVSERRQRMRAKEGFTVALLNRAVPCVQTDDGIRAVSGDRPINPTSVETYLKGKFGDALGDVRDAMRKLARSMTPAALGRRAYELYEEFRPEIPVGVKGWGAAGILSIDKIRSLAE
jgi:hypothetical protein